jgi:outer membrane receptor protein involved in Fe transport
LSVTRRVSPTLSLELGARFEGHRYRLDTRKGPIEPGDPQSGPVGKGTLSDRRLHVGVGISWKLAPSWRLDATVGTVAYQRYKSADHDGHKLDDATANGPAFACRLGLQVRF